MPLDDKALEGKRAQIHSQIVQLRNELNDKENLFARLDKIVPKTQTVLEDPEDPDSAKSVPMPIMDEGTGVEMSESRRQEIYDELLKAHPELAD